jgi:ligand-binding sensor domain-containing protein
MLSHLPLVALLAIASCADRAASAEARTAPTRPADAGGQIADYVVGAFEDSRGQLWFGTLGDGAARYDGRALTYFDARHGLDGSAAHSIAEDADGALWFAGHTGVYRYDGEAFTRFFETEGRVRTDRHGTVWVSTADRVYRWDGAALAELDFPLPAEPPAAYAIRPGRVTFQLEDSRGDRWFGTDGYGAFRHDGESFTQLTKQDGLCSNTVWSILEDRQGRIWFTCIQAYQPTLTGDGGVCRYDGETFTTFPEVRGLSGNDVYTIHEERSGHLWIGATGVGVYRYDGTAFTLFDETDRPDLTVNFGLQALEEDRTGTLWCGFSGGLFRFDGRKFVNVRRDGPWQ